MNSYQAILTRLRQSVGEAITTVEGSFAGDILGAAAGELARIYSQELDTVLERAFVQSARGEWLDAACADYGVNRKAAEDDEGLRRRTLDKIRLQASSGNEAHYKAWAEGLPGVRAAQAVGRARGPGTVDIYIVPREGEDEDAALPGTVREHIEGLRPVCVDARVAFAQPTAVAVSAELVLAGGATLQSITLQFEAALRDYLERVALSEQGGLISLTRVAGLLMACASRWRPWAPRRRPWTARPKGSAASWPLARRTTGWTCGSGSWGWSLGPIWTRNPAGRWWRQR